MSDPVSRGTAAAMEFTGGVVYCQQCGTPTLKGVACHYCGPIGHKIFADLFDQMKHSKPMLIPIENTVDPLEQYERDLIHLTGCILQNPQVTRSAQRTAESDSIDPAQAAVSLAIRSLEEIHKSIHESITGHRHQMTLQQMQDRVNFEKK